MAQKLISKLKLLLLIVPVVILLSVSNVAEAEEALGWKYDDGNWYYYESETYVAVNWRQIGKKWYFFDETGAMKTGWVYYQNQWYYMNGSGAMVTGWQKLGKKWYYFDKASGVMASNEYRQGWWLKASGEWDGRSTKTVWRKNSIGWWFRESSGWYPRDRWLWIDGYCFYFDKRGYMATDTWIGEEYVNADGVWADAYWGDIVTKYDTYKEDWNTVRHVIIPDVTKYSYEVIPLLEPFNEWFFIKTDNPDPNSFMFRDASSKYDSTDDEGNVSYGSICCSTSIYEDVIYTDKDTARVEDGYLAYGENVDGGTLILCNHYIDYEPDMPSWGIGTIKEDETEITVETPELLGFYDYLLTNYSTEGADFFDNMDSLENGLYSICLYSGAYVLGELHKSEDEPYYGISDSPHVDQNFYIQDPYYRSDNKSLFVSQLYPYRLDSLGFPSVMATLAQMLDENATYAWNANSHAHVDITYNGETKTYGGCGHGGGQGILPEQIKYWYKFDGSKTDAAQSISMQTLWDQLNYYGELEIPDDPIMDIPPLTWKQVREDVGDGSYVKIVNLGMLGSGGTVYSYLYDDGSIYEGSQGFASIGEMHNVWFDGRYFNKWENYYPGADFEETVELVQPGLVFKDALIQLPTDGRTYEFNYYNGAVEEHGYDPTTGKWKGYITYDYDEENQRWVANELQSIGYRDENGDFHPIDDEDFLDKTTITMEEALAMELDKNTNEDPSEFLIYDMVTPPGTKGTN